MATEPATGVSDAEIDDEGSRRLTSRQRRIEEQRRKIESMRREQRKKRAVWGTGILVGFLGLATLIVTTVRLPGGGVAQGRQLTDEGAGHVPEGSPVSYRSRPPASGSHYPAPAPYQFFTTPVPAGVWVHDLEHGAIAVLYRPDLCDQGCVEQLRDVYNATPSDGSFGRKKILFTPYMDMDRAIAVVGWRWVDEMDAVDRDRIIAFYRDRVNRGPETVP